MNDNDDKLANWSPRKQESPYEYGSQWPKFEISDFNWRIVSDEEGEEIFQNFLSDEKFVGEVHFFCDLWNLHLIHHPRVSFLIRPVQFIDKDQIEYQNYLDFNERVEDLFDPHLSVKIYVSYPFSEFVEIVISPLLIFANRLQTEGSKMYDAGYLAWQLGKAYGELFKHHYEEIGVYGHSLADLQLGSFLVFKNNHLRVSINS